MSYIITAYQVRNGGVRKDKYGSTGVRSFIASRQNKKVDDSFNKWKENSKKRQEAITIGKTMNVNRMAYEKNKSDKNLKSTYKSSKKEYKQALKSNTTYRKGQIKQQVRSDMARKYLSEAKKLQKQSDFNTNKDSRKTYDKFISNYNIERAKARRAPEVAANRSKRIASIKRGMTMTLKAAAATGAVAAGAVAVNSYLKKHDVRLNGKSVRLGKQTIQNVGEFVAKGKRIFRYF